MRCIPWGKLPLLKVSWLQVSITSAENLHSNIWISICLNNLVPQFSQDDSTHLTLITLLILVHSRCCSQLAFPSINWMMALLMLVFKNFECIPITLSALICTAWLSPSKPRFFFTHVYIPCVSHSSFLVSLWLKPLPLSTFSFQDFYFLPAILFVFVNLPVHSLYFCSIALCLMNFPDFFHTVKCVLDGVVVPWTQHCNMWPNIIVVRLLDQWLSHL